MFLTRFVSFPPPSVTLDGLLQIEEEEIGRVIDDVIREEEQQQQPSVSVEEVTNQVELQEEETKVDELPLLEQPSSSVHQQQDQEMIAVEPESEPEAEPQQEQQQPEEEEATTPGHEEEAPVMELEQEEEKEEVAVEEDLESFEPREEEDGGYLEDGYEEEEGMHTTTNRKSSIDLTSTLTLHQQQQHLLNKMQREELEQRFLRIEAHFRAEQATRAATESQLALLQREKDTLVGMIGQLSSQLSSSTSKKNPPPPSAAIYGQQQQQQRGICRQRHFLADTECSRLARAASLPLSSASSLTELERKKMEAELKKLADKARNAESAMKGVKAAVENALGTFVVASSGGEGPVSVPTKTAAVARPLFVTKTTTVKKVIESKPH